MTNLLGPRFVKSFPHQVKWRKRELRCTPAIGHYAGRELLFVYDEHPEQVP